MDKWGHFKVISLEVAVTRDKLSLQNVDIKDCRDNWGPYISHFFFAVVFG